MWVSGGGAHGNAARCLYRFAVRETGGQALPPSSKSAIFQPKREEAAKKLRQSYVIDERKARDKPLTHWSFYRPDEQRLVNMCQPTTSSRAHFRNKKNATAPRSTSTTTAMTAPEDEDASALSPVEKFFELLPMPARARNWDALSWSSGRLPPFPYRLRNSDAVRLSSEDIVLTRRKNDR